MTTNYNIMLGEKVAEIIVVMRQIFKGINNRIYNTLTEEYEEEMVGLCRLIPADWSRGVYHSFCIFMDIMDIVPWSKISAIVDKYPMSRDWFEMDTFKLFKNKIILRSKYPDDVKKRVLVLAERFSPVFQGVNELIKNPTPYLQRFTLLQQIEHENDDILKGYI